MLVAFSCKQRELCPSCSAKRGWELAGFLADHVLEDVSRARRVLTIPKMLRPQFFRKRELRGALARWVDFEPAPETDVATTTGAPRGLERRDH